MGKVLAGPQESGLWMGDTADRWTRLLDALEDDRAPCGGTGRTPSARWRAWHQRACELVALAQAARRAHELRPAGQAPTTLPDGMPEPAIVAVVERAIDDHMKSRPSEPEENEFATCRGTAKQLTPADRSLTEILARHGFIQNK